MDHRSLAVYGFTSNGDHPLNFVSHSRGSLQSNLPFSKWEGIFKDPMTTAAAIDRLVHHCVILELNIPSYRVEQAKKAKAEAAAE